VGEGAGAAATGGEAGRAGAEAGATATGATDATTATLFPEPEQDPMKKAMRKNRIAAAAIPTQPINQWKRLFSR
jgi:hypothetical protein